MENATLLAIETPGASSLGGDAGTPTTQTVGANGSGVRCFIAEPTRNQLISLTNKVAGVNGVVYIGKQLIAGLAIVPMQLLNLKIDGTATGSVLQVVYVRDRQLLGGLSHFECFVKDLI